MALIQVLRMALIQVFKKQKLQQPNFMKEKMG